MEKWEVEKIADYWVNWEAHAGESFIDYFLDDNINNMGIVVGYFCGKFPELGRYILEESEYYLPWKFIQDGYNKIEDRKYVPSISELVESFYNVEDENGVLNKDNYDKSVYVWCSLIHDIDIYYERFTEWIKSNGYDEL